MEKEVLVCINGMQFSEDFEDSMEVISPGTYYYKNNKHYVTYEDVPQDGGAPVKNILKISGETVEPCVELIKQGGVGTHLIFKENQNSISCYETEYGSFMLGFQANKINLKNTEDEISVRIDYSLEMNYEHVSDNSIVINVKSKSGAQSLHLAE